MKNEYGVECYRKTQQGDEVRFKFDRVDLPFYGPVSLANGTQFTIGVFERNATAVVCGADPTALFVGIEGIGCYTFSEFVATGYAAEKLNLGGDAANVADFINAQVCFDDEDYPQQGKVNEQWL